MYKKCFYQKSHPTNLFFYNLFDFVVSYPSTNLGYIKHRIMARKTSTELYEFVKSMTPSEKRYFKIFASLHTVGTENKYMKLFDLMEQQETYNEADLIVGVNDKGGVTFSKLKKYLYDLILKAMRNFNSDKNGTHQLTAAIDDVSILFNKGLYAQALKAIGKAEKIVAEFEMISYQLLIDNWKRRIDLHIENSKTSTTNFSGNLQRYQELNDHMEAYGAIQEFARRWSVITEKSQLPVLAQQKLEKVLPETASSKARFFQLRIRSIYFRLVRDYKSYLTVAQEAYELSNQHQAFQNEDVLIYTLEPLLEYCNALLNARQFSDFLHYTKKATPYIKASKLTISNEGRANIDACVNLMKSEYDRLNGKKSKYQDYLITIKAIKQNPELHPSQALKNLYYWELINWHFLVGEFKEAIETIDRMKRDISDYQTIQAANTVKWICFYELKWVEDLKIDLESEQWQSTLETEFSSCLGKQIMDETLGKWMNLKKKLSSVQEMKEEKLHFKFFDFTGWVSHKLLDDSTLSSVKRQLHYYHH